MPEAEKQRAFSASLASAEEGGDGAQEEKQNREAEIKRANAELLAKFSEHVKQFEVVW